MTSRAATSTGTATAVAPVGDQASEPHGARAQDIAQDAAEDIAADPRPQPLGALPWPAGMLVLPPAGPDGAHALDALLGGVPPSTWPAAWEFLRHALDDDPVAAAAALPSGGRGDAPAWARYDRAVLLGGDAAFDDLPAVGPQLAALVAVARFSVGLEDAPPEHGAQLRGEVAAVVHSARASAALEAGQGDQALAELLAGAHAASGAGAYLLAGTLHATRAELLREQAGDPRGAAAAADAALAVLPASATSARAEALVSRALARQELAGQDRAGLLAVVADLSEALTFLHEDTEPLLWATAQQHLALAYLLMPMGEQGDRLRLGVAVAALRAALRVLTPQTAPVAWASAQLNLANALAYLPSAHQEDNLRESVDLYEEVLRYRDPGADPAGYARTLANQGTALAHLGAYVDAADRLGQAEQLLTAGGDPDTLATVRATLATVHAELAGGEEA